MRVIRLWQHQQILKRAGVAFLPGGISSAKLGSCAVLCPACPRRFVFDLPEREGVGGDGVGGEETADGDDVIDLFVLRCDSARVTEDGRVLIRIDSEVDE